MFLRRASSVLVTSFSLTRAMRLETRKTWVSTAMVWWPWAQFRKTLAVLRPTPGNVCSNFRSAGILESYFSRRILAVAMAFLALELKSPMVLMCFFRPFSPNFSIFLGVSAILKRDLVALLTWMSVLWAERRTAISRVNSLWNSSSVCGSGSFLAKISKILLILVLFILLLF